MDTIILISDYFINKNGTQGNHGIFERLESLMKDNIIISISPIETFTNPEGGSAYKGRTVTTKALVKYEKKLYDSDLDEDDF